MSGIGNRIGRPVGLGGFGVAVDELARDVDGVAVGVGDEGGVDVEGRRGERVPKQSDTVRTSIPEVRRRVATKWC